jgi:TetR/AcrR family transcriptional repressor of nem operon
MARIKEFCREQALEDSMALFWTQGYTATSIQQLLKVMNLSRSSMYSEFGNKHNLFVEALTLYRHLSKELINTISSAKNPVEAIQKFYEVGFIRIDKKILCRGCLFVNTILELSNVDDELASLAIKYFNEIEEALKNCFKKCVINGTLHKDQDPVKLANYFITLSKGMRVVVRQKENDDYLQGVIETAMLVFHNAFNNKATLPT